jgi:hypothetical protein
MTNPIGPLLAADESLCHQVTDTFAIVGTSDRAWTEKVCAMAAARDGSLQLAFGLGKYPNRGVLDGYAGVSRGVEQMTVRASRRLSNDPELTAVGPVRYEVVEPMRSVRFSLQPNEHRPLAFEWLFEAAVPAQLEDRTHLRDGYRTSADLVRYHQVGVASGWVEIAGERTELDPDTWVSTRDHSWGVRYDVGTPRTDIEQVDPLDGLSFRMIWCPLLMERPDGTRYALFLHFQIIKAPGLLHQVAMGGVEQPDGGMDKWTALVPELRYDPVNRRLRGGQIHATTESGSNRTLQIEVVSETGFHLGAGLYFGLDGHHHGEWRGDLHVESERIADCSTAEEARRLHQIRDTVVHVIDPVGGGEGWGNCQPIITGGDQELGLTAESSFW